MELTELQNGHGCHQVIPANYNTQHMVMVNSDIQWFHCKYIFPHALSLLGVCVAFLYHFVLELVSCFWIFSLEVKYSHSVLWFYVSIKEECKCFCLFFSLCACVWHFKMVERIMYKILRSIRMKPLGTVA